MEYINIAPTWESAVKIHLMCIENGDNESTKQDSRDEIIRLARAYDAIQSGFDRVPE
jgi:hypothetical protein